MAFPVLGGVSGVTIEDHLLGNSVRESLTIDFVDNMLPSISFSLPPGARDVLINGKATTTLNDTVEIVLDCQSCRIRIEYTLAGVITPDSSDARAFSRTLNLPQTPNLLRYSVMLPQGAFITSSTKSNDPAIVPRESAIRTDGTHIIIEWEEATPSLPKRYFLRYSTHEQSEGVLEDFTTELGEWHVWLIALLALVIGVALGMGVQRHLREPLSASMPYVPVSLLSPDERELLSFLERSKPVWQRELVTKTGWSKSKVSAIITNLDYKQIISREKHGRSYKVTLVKEIGE